MIETWKPQGTTMIRWLLLALTLSATQAGAAEAANYADRDRWLCRPDHPHACAADLSTTVVSPDGALRREDFVPAANPPIDCFYVYPTVSLDPQGNSDFAPGP